MLKKNPRRRKAADQSLHVNYRSISEEGVAGEDYGIAFADAGLDGYQVAVFDGGLHVMPMRHAIFRRENHRLAAAIDHRRLGHSQHLADVLADF